MISNRSKDIRIKALGVIKLANVKGNPLEVAKAMQISADRHGIDIEDIYVEFVPDEQVARKTLMDLNAALEEKSCSMVVVPTLADISSDENELNTFMDDMDQKDIAVYEVFKDTLWLPDKYYNNFLLFLMWLESDAD